MRRLYMQRGRLKSSIMVSKYMDVTSSVCPERVLLHSPDSTSQSLRVLSADPVITLPPQGENAKEGTARVCPINVPSQCPVAQSQSFEVESSELEATNLPYNIPLGCYLKFYYFRLETSTFWILDRNPRFSGSTKTDFSGFVL